MKDASTSRTEPKMRIACIAIHAVPLAAFFTLLGATLGNRTAMETYFLKWSYYFILALTIWWTVSGFRYLCSKQISLTSLLKKYWPGLVIALLMTLIVASSVPMGFKTLSDETNLVSVSKSMLESKTCRNVTMTKIYYGQPHTVRFSVPKRPLVFPFLIHLGHLVLGYSFKNAFFINLSVLFILLVGVYILFTRLADATAAVATMLFVASTPLIPILATSAGFDLINSVFMLFVLVLVYFHLKQGSRRSFSFLWLSLLIFANIRYESALFGLVIVLLLLAMRGIEGKHIRSCSLALCSTPLILLPTIWQRIITVKSTVSSDSATFSLNHLLSHGGVFLKSLLDFNFYLPFGNILTAVSLLIYAYLLWWHIKNHRHLSVEHKKTAGIFAAVFLLNVSFYLSYFWGRYDHPSSARFFVFMSILMALGPVWLRYFRPRWLPSPFLMGLSIVALVTYYPVAINGTFMDTLTLNRLTEHTMAYLEPYEKSNVMAITERPGQLVAVGYGAVNFRYARKAAFRDEVRRHLYPHVVVFQKISYKNDLPTPGTLMDIELPLVTMQEVQVTSTYYLRISEVAHAVTDRCQQRLRPETPPPARK